MYTKQLSEVYFWEDVNEESCFEYRLYKDANTGILYENDKVFCPCCGPSGCPEDANPIWDLSSWKAPSWAKVWGVEERFRQAVEAQLECS